MDLSARTVRRLLVSLAVVGMGLAAVAAPSAPPGAASLRLGMFGPIRTPDLPVLAAAISDPAALPVGADGRAVLLIQFREGPRAEEEAWLAAASATVLDRVPERGYVVAIDAPEVPGLLALPLAWAGELPPEAKVAPGLWKRFLRGEEFAGESWDVRTASGVAVDAVLRAGLVPRAALREVVEDVGDVAIARIDARPASLIALLSRPEVVRVAPTPGFIPTNDVARRTLRAPDLWATHPALSLYGRGQVIGLIDAGFDSGSADPAVLFDDFEDASGASRVQALIDYAGDGDLSDPESHGTACAATALGNGARSPCRPALRDYDDPGCYAGIAPEARLVFTAVYDGTYYERPDDVRDWFIPAHDAGARIHSNSWASQLGDCGYEADARAVDDFVWTHPDDLVLFSAGNQGNDNDADGYTDPMSLNQPGTAKNALAVGATENDRAHAAAGGPPRAAAGDPQFPVEPLRSDDESDDPNGMVAWSSRGPTLDGRTKPDVAAPGQWVMSALGPSQRTPGDEYGAAGGTSLSTPQVAGVAALFRQYLVERAGFTPSAALLKALLLLGARSTAPGERFPGYPNYAEIPAVRPNSVQGWGRADAAGLLGDLAADRAMVWDRQTLAEGETWTWAFHLPDGVTGLHAMLAWTDAPGSPITGGALVNDLDLDLRREGTAEVWYPNAANPGVRTFVAQEDPWSPFPVVQPFEDVTAPGGTDGYAVRFTPDAYPCALTGVTLNLGPTTAAPYHFTLRVRAVNGNGMPSAVPLATQTVNVINPSNLRLFLHVPLDAPVPIASGDVFVEYGQRAGTPGIYHYNRMPTERSWHWGAAGGWTNVLDTNYAIRAVFESAAGMGPEDRVNPQEGIDLPAPGKGDYRLTVTAHRVSEPAPGTGGQPFALVLWGEGVDWRNATAIDLISFIATGEKGAARLDWETATEADNAGFHLWRANSETGAYARITSALIPSEGSPTGGAKYAFTDRDVKAGQTYWYKLEDVDIHGNSAYHGPANATVLREPLFGCGMADGATGGAGVTVLLALVALGLSFRRRRNE